jgi:hypothetical protein
MCAGLMKRITLIALFLSIFFCGLHAAASCQFAIGAAYAPSQLQACFNQIPLDPIVKQKTINLIKQALELHPSLDLVIEKTGFNFFEELEKIRHAEFTSDYDFHRTLYFFSKHFPDFGTTYIPPYGYSSFYTVFPWKFVVGKDVRDLTVAANPTYFKQVVPASVYGKRVVSVDGVNILEYLKTLVYGEAFEDFNLRLWLSGSVNNWMLGSLFPKADTQTWRFSDGTNLTLPIQVITVYQNILGLTNLKSLVLTSSKRSQSNSERISGIHPVFSRNSDDTRHEIYDYGFFPLNSDGCTNVTSKTASDGSAIHGILHCGEKNIPFLSIITIPPRSIALFYKQAILDFVDDIAFTRSKYTFIDLTIALDNCDLAVIEWTINVLSQTYSQPFNPATYASKSFRILFDARLTDQKASELLSVMLQSKNSVIIDPTDGEPFERTFCLTRNPITSDRIKERKDYRDSIKEKFSEKFFLADYNDFLELPTFKTTFYITLSGASLAGPSSFLPLVLRKRGLAKLYGAGHLPKTSFRLTAQYFGPQMSWNYDVVPNFPLDSKNVFNFPTSADFFFPLFEAYVSDLKIPQIFQTFKVDDVISWSHYSPVSKPYPAYVFDLFSSVYHKLHIKPRNLSPLPSFVPSGKCYATQAKPIKEDNKAVDIQEVGYDRDYDGDHDTRI